MDSLFLRLPQNSLSPRLIFVEKARFGGLIFFGGGGAGTYYWREFCASKMVRLIIIIFGMDFVSENAAPEGTRWRT